MPFARTCGFCHAFNEILAHPTVCSSCGHWGDVPRQLCRCDRCVKGPPPVTEQDYQECLDWLLRRQPAK